MTRWLEVRRETCLVLAALPLLVLAMAASSPAPSESPSSAPTPPPASTPTPPHGVINLSSTQVPEGAMVTVIGTGFFPGEPVTLYLDTADRGLGGLIADQQGSFRQAVTIPASASIGSHIICVQQASPRCAQLLVQAAEPATAPPTPTPSATPTETPNPTPSATGPIVNRPGGTGTSSALGAFLRSPFGIFLILLLLTAIATSIWLIIRSRRVGKPLPPGPMVTHASPGPRPGAPPPFRAGPPGGYRPGGPAPPGGQPPPGQPGGYRPPPGANVPGGQPPGPPGAYRPPAGPAPRGPAQPRPPAPPVWRPPPSGQPPGRPPAGGPARPPRPDQPPRRPPPRPPEGDDSLDLPKPDE